MQISLQDYFIALGIRLQALSWPFRRIPESAGIISSRKKEPRTTKARKLENTKKVPFGFPSCSPNFVFS